MADNHGNTPAAWTGVTVAFLGFLVGSIACLFDPVNIPLLWVGIGLGLASLVVFAAMVKMGLHDSRH